MKGGESMPSNRALSLFSTVYTSLREVGSRERMPYTARHRHNPHRPCNGAAVSPLPTGKYSIPTLQRQRVACWLCMRFWWKFLNQAGPAERWQPIHFVCP